jgi:hypothetical protein
VSATLELGAYTFRERHGNVDILSTNTGEYFCVLEAADLDEITDFLVSLRSEEKKVSLLEQAFNARHIMRRINR